MDDGDIPHSLALNYVYDLPVGRGKKFGGGMNGIENAVLGGWQVTGITTAQPVFRWRSCPSGNAANVHGGNAACRFDRSSFKTGNSGGTNESPPFRWQRNIVSSIRRLLRRRLTTLSAMLIASSPIYGLPDTWTRISESKSGSLSRRGSAWNRRPDVQRVQPRQFRHA